MQITLTVNEFDYMFLTHRLDRDRLLREIEHLNTEFQKCSAQLAQEKTVTSTVSAHVLAELCRLLAKGHKIEAIKYVRSVCNIGLKEAKALVEGEYNP